MIEEEMTENWAAVEWNNPAVSAEVFTKSGVKSLALAMGI